MWLKATNHKAALKQNHVTKIDRFKPITKQFWNPLRDSSNYSHIYYTQNYASTVHQGLVQDLAIKQLVAQVVMLSKSESRVQQGHKSLTIAITVVMTGFQFVPAHHFSLSSLPTLQDKTKQQCFAVRNKQLTGRPSAYFLSRWSVQPRLICKMAVAKYLWQWGVREQFWWRTGGDYVPSCVRCKGTTDCGHVRDRFLGRNAIHQESESIAGSALVIIIINHANYGGLPRISWPSA